MGVLRLVVAAFPLFFVAVGLASAASGVMAPANRPVAGTMLVLVGLTLFVSLWLAGLWTGGDGFDG